MLRDLFLGAGADLLFAVEQNGARGRGALVDGEDERSHCQEEMWGGKG